MNKIVDIQVKDVRFPTSLELDGSDAVNVSPDYSASYVEITCESGEKGYALVFTGGRGNEVVVRAIESLSELLINQDVEILLADMRGASNRVVHDTQFRWIGPEKGVSHMAAGALVNALWDIKARRAGKPLWRYLAELSPEELVDVIDFTHITDALTPEEALEILREGQEGKQERINELIESGYPAYTTSPGWLGYSDEKLVRLSKEAVADGFKLIKLKVGTSVEDDKRRLGLAREAVGDDILLAIDANQRWDVDDAIEWTNGLQGFGLWWIEEPTSTDDVLGHARIRKEVSPIKVATGEAVQNRIIFKQLLMAEAIDVLQLDSVRVAGVNENLAIMLMAKKFGVAVCPHAGGVGLCEMVLHFSFLDYAVISTDMTNKFIEYVDHLHEHFVEPVVVENGRYLSPKQAGNGAQMHQASVQEWEYPNGPGWVKVGDQAAVNQIPELN